MERELQSWLDDAKKETVVHQKEEISEETGSKSSALKKSRKPRSSSRKE
jgi:hypothetical protein